MGVTVQQLQQNMTAHEFGQHYLLEQVEPLHPPVRWPDPDEQPAAQVDDAPLSVEQIMGRARQAGMVN